MNDKSLADAGKWLADKWKQLEARYGRKAALAMAITMLGTMPAPGNIAAVIGAAEAIRGVSGYFSKTFDEEEQKRMVTKSIKKGRFLNVNDEEMSATFVLSTEAEDRDGETVNPTGGDLTDYAKNPVVPFNHNTDDFPLGTSGDKDGKVAIWNEEIELDGQRKMALLGKCFFSKANPKGPIAYGMVKEGVLRGCSISFIPLGHVGKNRSGGNHYDKWKLLEWSICTVGSNPDAVSFAQKKLKAAKLPKTQWLSELDAILQHTKQRGVSDFDADKVNSHYMRGDSPKLTAFALVRTSKAFRAVEERGQWYVVGDDGKRYGPYNDRKAAERKIQAMNLATQWGHNKVSANRMRRTGAMGFGVGTFANMNQAVAWLKSKLHHLTERHGAKMGIALATAALAHVVPHDLVHEILEAYEVVHGTLKHLKTVRKWNWSKAKIEEYQGSFWISVDGHRVIGPYPYKEAAEGALEGFLPMKKLKRKMWIKNKSAWLKSEEGPLDEETQAHIEEMGLDEVRIEDEEPPVEEGWEEETEEKYLHTNDNGVKVQIFRDPNSAGWKYSGAGGGWSYGPYDTEDEAKEASNEIKKSMEEELTERVEEEVPKLADASDEVIERCADQMVEEGMDEEEVAVAKRLVKRKRLKRKSGVEYGGAPEPQEGPVGLRAIRRWMKAIEDDMQGIEQKDVLGAGSKALKILKQVMNRAYKDFLGSDETEEELEEEEEVEKAYWSRLEPKRKPDGKWEVVDQDGKFAFGPYYSEEEAKRTIARQVRDGNVGGIKSKKLSKANKAQLKEMADFLQDVADAPDTPKRLSAGMKHYLAKCKDLMGGEEEDVTKNEDDLTDEQVDELGKAFEEMQSGMNQVTEKLFRVSGRRF